MKSRIRKFTALGLAFSMLVLSACNIKKNTENTTSPEHDEEYFAQLEEASTTPFGKYPELITYTLGKLTGTNNSNMPYGDTYENNAYTRFLKDMLNVQNLDSFENYDEQYNSSVSMAISSGQIPDIMIVSSLEDLQLLVEYDMIEDLTDSFDNCLSDTIKDIYDSYGDSIMNVVTFDGKIMAIPETNIEDGPNLVWLRKDWMDELGLEEPKTLLDVENIVAQFVEKDPGNNGEGNTVGLVCGPSLCGECGYSSEYLLDIVFATYGAYPKQWVYDENGDIVYGSVQEEAKNALEHIKQMYDNGILDENFLLRTSSNIIELIVNGQCGSFFGPWWAPNNPLMDAKEANPDAEWMPYLIATDDDGSTSYYSQNPSYKYVVVRKGYEHPEIACKIVSVLFDYIKYEENDNDEFKEYYQKNVDPTARPLAVNIDYNNTLSLCYSEITSALNGEKQPEDLNLLEYSYYEACKDYLSDSNNASSEDWAAYTSRVTSCALLSEHKLNKVESLFFDETDTMSNEWWKLEELENKTYLQIVTGEIPLEDFDKFVNMWYKEGGDTITEEVRESVSE